MHPKLSTILCIYHSPCNDGSASAAALQHRLRQANYLDGAFEMRFLPYTYTTDWNAPLAQSFLDNQVHADHEVAEIFLVDVSMSAVKYNQIVEHLRAEHRIGPEAPRTTCIDHHISARERQAELATFCHETYIHIGPGLSGATLVWNYFNERFGETLETPQLLRYVADQDIWEWLLPNSGQVNAALNVLDGTVDSMAAELAESLAAPERWLARRIAEGTAITAMVDSQVMRQARNVVEYPIAGNTRLLVVNATCFSSELGNHLCEQHEHTPNVVALIYTIQENWHIRCSFRSVPGGAVNARMLAERFGGGGHDHAAGCRFTSYAELHAALDALGAQE